MSVASRPSQYSPPSQLSPSSLEPVSMRQPPGGPQTFKFGAPPLVESRIARRAPPGGGSSIDLSTLEPHEIHPDESPRAKGHTSAKLYHAHAAGIQTAHITLGTAAAASPPTELGDWAEPAEHAGSPTHNNAKLQTRGSAHYFGQTIWPTRTGELAPFHARELSSLGKSHQKGHFVPGQQSLEDPGYLTPRGSARGRAEVSGEQWRGGRPSTPHAGRASASGNLAAQAQKIHFDGAMAKDLISGESCLS